VRSSSVDAYFQPADGVQFYNQWRVIDMKLKVIIHEAEEGGYWAEVPAIPGCATQGNSFEELLHNIYEAVEACLSVDIEHVDILGKNKIMEIAV
jgi:predicted RNase H-like HicB family nuclease